METNSPAATDRDRPVSSTAPPQSPVRLLVLLGLLVLAVAALGYDHFVARPGVDAADKQLQAFVEAQNKKGVKDAALVTSADVQSELGRAPTMVVVDDEKGATVEYYCWWGNMPHLNRQRHFIAVVYVGQKPRHYSSHYREEPPAEAYPIADATPPALQKGDTLPPDDAAAEGATKEKSEQPKDEKPEDEKSKGEKSKGEKPGDATESPKEKGSEEPAKPKAD